MPHRVSRSLLAALLLAPAAGAVLVEDLGMDPCPACPPRVLTIQLVLVAAAPADPAALDAATAQLLTSFEEVARGRVRLVAAGPAVLLARPAVAAGLDRGYAEVAGAYFARADAGAPEILVLVAADGPAVSPECACVAWSARIPAGGASAFGAWSGFRGVVGIGDLAVIEDAGEARLRLAHEIAHVFCCRADGLTVGGHWRADASIPPDDPMREGGTRHPAPRFSDATLAAMGATFG